MSRKSIIEVITALLVLLFAYAGLSKLADYNNFKLQLSASPWALLASLSGIVAWLLPLVEILLVVLLTIPRTRLLGLYLSFITMLMFTAYLSILLASGVDKPCECGGVISNMSWETHLVFNIFFTVIALIGIFLQKKENHPTKPIQGSYA